MLAKGEIQLRVGLPPTLPGLIKLITLKVGFTKLTDFGLSNLIKAAPNIQHLELNRCELTDIGLKYFTKDLPQLKFLDLTSVTAVNLASIDEIKAKRPQLLLRQFRAEKVDPEDTGLRVPRRVIEKDDGKNKKKKK